MALHLGTSAPPMTARRTFVHIGGYYPLTPEDNYRRFRREYGRFLKAWSVQGEFAPLEKDADWARWDIATAGPDWSSQVDHILFRWEDIIEADRARGWPARVGLGLLTFADFVANGALLRYFRLAWRYAGFFLYPFLLLALLYGAAFWATRWGMALAGLGPNAGVALLVAVAPFFALLHLFGGALKLDHLLDDWIYGRGIVRRSDPAVEKKLHRLAEHLAQREGEILVVGHSFGAIWGAELVARIAELRPDGEPIRFASVGASILKIGLNSAARPLRRALERMTASPRVIWWDFNTLNDVMNFHRVEPMAALGLQGPPAKLCNVRFRPMVSPEYYTKMQRNFFRLHNQFISGNDNRAPYDYFMLMCGPFPMEAIADAPDGAVPWLDASGGLTEAGKAAALTS